MHERGRTPFLPAVFFDLDGTLLRGTSVSAATAEWLGRAGELDALERDYAAGRVSNAEIASVSAPWFAGVAVADAEEALAGLSWIEGIEDVVRALPFCAIATVTASWAAEWAARRFGFAAWSGTEMAVADGRLTGVVAKHFDAQDKAAWVSDVCAARGVPLAEAVAVGDSRSDLPTFEVVGKSIALNADEAARAAADVAIDTDDLRDLLHIWGRCSVMHA
jgi:phosphoserine phosphatase